MVSSLIELFSGTPGSGKSLDAASCIRHALTKPRGEDMPVIANFDVNVTNVKRPHAFHHFSNDELTPDLLTTFADDFWKSTTRHFSEDYLLLVLDECQLVFNARSWMSKGRAGMNDSRMDWLEFLSQHRKYGYRIILIAQNAKMIDNQFRMLIETEVNHRKVEHMGMVGHLVSLLFLNRLFLRVKYLYQSKERLGMSAYIGNRRDYDMYDTYARHKQVSTSTT